MGSLGSIRISDSGYTANSFQLFTENEESGVETGRWIEMQVQETTREAFTSQAQHVVDCILKDEAPFVSGEEARRTLELTLAIYRSMETHQPVILDAQG